MLDFVAFKTGTMSSPKEQADFVGAFKHQDASRSETQRIFPSISALKTHHTHL